jgi:hypothetical protein
MPWPADCWVVAQLTVSARPPIPPLEVDDANAVWTTSDS